MNQRKLETYRAGNIEAARIVVADLGRYPAGSLLYQWATAVLSKAESDQGDRDQGGGSGEVPARTVRREVR